jgi:hypothetical protein
MERLKVDEIASESAVPALRKGQTWFMTLVRLRLWPTSP